MASEHTLDVARRAKRLYEERLRAELEPSHPHEYVAIEPDSGEFFLGSSVSAAVAAAKEVHPDRLAFVVRVGHATGLHLGGVARRL
jgi:hypothetical protein